MTPGNFAGYANDLMNQMSAAAAFSAATGGGGVPGAGGGPGGFGRSPFPNGLPGLDPNARISIPGLPAGKP